MHLECPTVPPSPKPKHICVISKFHQLAREKHDIYRPTAPGSSDHASEFLMRNRLVPLEINIGRLESSRGQLIILTHSQPFAFFVCFSLAFHFFCSYICQQLRSRGSKRRKQVHGSRGKACYKTGGCLQREDG